MIPCGVLNSDPAHVAMQSEISLALDPRFGTFTPPATFWSQVVNDALGLGIGERDCSLSGIAGKLSGDPAYSRLEAALRRFQASSEYRYVADGSNRTKHRNALYSNIWARVEDGGGVNVKQSLRAFEHDARLHDEAEVAEINSLIDAIRNRVGSILDELLAVLIANDRAGHSDE